MGALRRVFMIVAGSTPLIKISLAGYLPSSIVPDLNGQVLKCRLIRLLVGQPPATWLLQEQVYFTSPIRLFQSLRTTCQLPVSLAEVFAKAVKEMARATEVQLHVLPFIASLSLKFDTDLVPLPFYVLEAIGAAIAGRKRKRSNSKTDYLNRHILLLS